MSANLRRLRGQPYVGDAVGGNMSQRRKLSSRTSRGVSKLADEEEIGIDG